MTIEGSIYRNHIDELLKESGKSIKEYSVDCNISRQAMYNIIKGDVMPRLDTCWRICRVLAYYLDREITLDDVFYLSWDCYLREE